MTRSTLCYCLVLAAALVGCSRPGPEEVVAFVDDTVVRVGDLQKSLQREKETYGEDGFGRGEKFFKLKQKLLDEIIDRKLLVRAAVDAGVGVTDEELDQELRIYKSQYTEVSFQNMLKETGISNEEWVQTKKENLIVKKYLDGMIERNGAVSPEAISGYYESNKEQFQVPESVRVRQIVTDTKEKAESILRRLSNGENFAKLAADLSLSPDRRQGGDLGFIAKGTFPREFEVCFTMNPGEVSPIIPSLYGFHLFKVLEKAPAKTLSLDEVKDQVTLYLKQRLRQDGRENLLKELRGKSKIQINEELLKRVSL